MDTNELALRHKTMQSLFKALQMFLEFCIYVEAEALPKDDPACAIIREHAIRLSDELVALAADLDDKGLLPSTSPTVPTLEQLEAGLLAGASAPTSAS